jgi:hypothetical protein
VAQWITRLTTDQKIPGSNPGKVVIFLSLVLLFGFNISSFFINAGKVVVVFCSLLLFHCCGSLTCVSLDEMVKEVCLRPVVFFRLE